jgi:hypothetical protein
MTTKPPSTPPEPPHAARARLHALLLHGVALGAAVLLAAPKLPPLQGE